MVVRVADPDEAHEALERARAIGQALEEVALLARCEAAGRGLTRS
jgi:hypothetical protein